MDVIEHTKRYNFASSWPFTFSGGGVDFPSLAFLEDNLPFVAVAVVVLFVELVFILTVP